MSCQWASLVWFASFACCVWRPCWRCTTPTTRLDPACRLHAHTWHQRMNAWAPPLSLVGSFLIRSRSRSRLRLGKVRTYSVSVYRYTQAYLLYGCRTHPSMWMYACVHTYVYIRNNAIASVVYVRTSSLWVRRKVFLALLPPQTAACLGAHWSTMSRTLASHSPMSSFVPWTTFARMEWTWRVFSGRRATLLGS